MENLFADDMETDLGWTAGLPGDTATTGQWLRADPVGTEYQPEDDHTPDPGVLCFVTGNSFPGDTAGAADVDGGTTTLLSPVFDLTGNDWAMVSYWRYYVLETSYDDEFVVDITNNAGASWSNLETVTSTTGWFQARFELEPADLAFTDQMQLRFRATDTGSGSLVEALIDDLVILGTRNDLTGTDTPPVAVSLAAFPNWSTVQCGHHLDFALPTPAPRNWWCTMPPAAWSPARWWARGPPGSAPWSGRPTSWPAACTWST